MTQGITGLLFADKGYICKKLFLRLYKKGLKLITGLKKNMKNCLMNWNEKILLRKRSLVETVFDYLKNKLQIEHARHRSPINAFVHILSTLISYQLKPSKPSISYDYCFLIHNNSGYSYKKDQQAQQALGRSKGGFTTKIHACVDALGNPLRFVLTPGQSSEIKQALELIKGFHHANVLGDKAFDCDEFIQQIESQQCISVIPPRSNRKVQREVDYTLYKERHLIECFFSKIKHFRRIFSRFDKMAIAYMGFLAFASTVIWLR